MAPRARIFQQPKNAMQSGYAATHEWVLEFEPGSAARPDPLMGWSGGADTRTQSLRLKFDTREEAVAYADKHTLHYEVELPHKRRFVPKPYADNFRYGRAENWTH
jgi:hypothetical protein